jgi:hypothetical protein
MLRKLTLALVAAASLSAMALAPSAASAKPWGGGWGHHHHFGGFGGFGGLALDLIGADSGCFVQQPVPTRYGYRLATVNVCGGY